MLEIQLPVKVHYTGSQCGIKDASGRFLFRKTVNMLSHEQFNQLEVDFKQIVAKLNEAAKGTLPCGHEIPDDPPLHCVWCKKAYDNREALLSEANKQWIRNGELKFPFTYGFYRGFNRGFESGRSVRQDDRSAMKLIHEAAELVRAEKRATAHSINADGFCNLGCC